MLPGKLHRDGSIACLNDAKAELVQDGHKNSSFRLVRIRKYCDGP